MLELVGAVVVAELEELGELGGFDEPLGADAGAPFSFGVLKYPLTVFLVTSKTTIS